MSTNLSPVARLSSLSSFNAASQVNGRSASTPAGAAAAPTGDGCGRHHGHAHHHHASAACRTDTIAQTCFYFTVFFSNNPPIFHSNRIPLEKLGGKTKETSAARESLGEPVNGAAAFFPPAVTDRITSSTSSSPSFSQCPMCQEQHWKTVFGEPKASRTARPCIGYPYADGFPAARAETEDDDDDRAAVVGDYRSATATMEEVPQQTLQNVAFPTTFGSCERPCAYPIRALGRHSRSTSAVSSPTVCWPSHSVVPQPPPLQSSSATDAGIAGKANANSLKHDEGNRCAPSRATGALGAHLDTTSDSAGSLSLTTGALSMNHSTLVTASVDDVKASETTALGAELPSGVTCLPSHLRPVIVDVVSSGGDTAAALCLRNTDTTNRSASCGSPQRLGQVRARRPRPLIAPAATSLHADGEASLSGKQQQHQLPQPTALTASATATENQRGEAFFVAATASTASLGISPIVSTPKAPQASNTTGDAARQPSPATPADLGTSMNGAAASTLEASATSQEGPPWNMRVEDVRSAKGELRYYRIVLTVSFTALVTTHTGLMHSMQTRHAAAALVILCPPCGLQYRFFLYHVDILRSVLNRTTEFSIRTVQRFFGLLYSPTQRRKGSQQQVLRDIAAQLEMHPEAVETYCAVKAELASALCLRFPLPLLVPTTSAWVVPVLMRSSLASSRTRSLSRRTSEKWTSGPRGASATLMGWLTTDDTSTSPVEVGSSVCALSRSAASSSITHLADILHEAAAYVREYSEPFSSAFICGVLSLARSGRSGSNLHVRFSVGNGSDGATATGARPTNITSPCVQGQSALPSSMQSALPPKSVREALSASVSGCGVPASWVESFPEWLSPYSAYWRSLADTHALQHTSGSGVISFGKPTSTEKKRNDAGHPNRSTEDVDGKDAVLMAHASAGAEPLETASAGSLRAGAAGTWAVSTHSPEPHSFTEDSGSRAAAKSDARLPLATEGSGTELSVSRDMTVTLGGAASSGAVTAASCTQARGSSFPAKPLAPTRAAALSLNSPVRTAGDKAAPLTAKEDEYLLHRGRLGRVIIFTPDGVLARRLLVIAAFLWTCGGGGDAIDGGVVAQSGAPGRPCATEPQHQAHDSAEEVARRNAAAQHMYEMAVAAAVTSAEYANVPIQWVAEEFSEARMSALCSRFSPENSLLIVVPRQLQCRRVSLRKYVTGTTVLVEEHRGKGARICSAPFPFRCTISKQVIVQPDPTVTTLVREACNLHQGSHGTVHFADVFQRMAKWLHWQSAAAVLAREVHIKATATIPASSAPLKTWGASLTRFVSADAIWTSSDAFLGATATSPGARLTNDGSSRLTTPVVASPALGVIRSVSTSVSSPLNRLDTSCDLESVEESLLPGSKGDAGAWAYATSASTNATFGLAATAAAVSTPRAESTPSTSMLLASQGLLKPPSAFTNASCSAASPSKTTSPSVKFFSWFHSSPTSSSSAAATQNHPILSPTTLGQMYIANGGVDGQLQRLLAGAEEEEEGMIA